MASMPLTLSLEPLVEEKSDAGVVVAYQEQGPESASLSARLKRVWQERGDFSQLSSASILQAQRESAKTDAEQGADGDKRLTAAEMMALHAGMIDQVAYAQSEISLALDLMAVLHPTAQETAPIQPSLPPGTLGTARAQVEVVTSEGDQLLTMATTLKSIKTAALRFFEEFDRLEPEPEKED